MKVPRQRVRNLENENRLLQQEAVEANARTDAVDDKVTSLDSVTTVTDDYTVTAQDRTIVADKATPITITLPPLINVVGVFVGTGRKYNIVAAGANPIVVAVVATSVTGTSDCRGRIKWDELRRKT